MSLLIALCLYLMNIGERYRAVGKIEAAARCLLGVLIGVVVFTAVYGIFTNQMYGRYVFLLSFGCGYSATLSIRLLSDLVPIDSVKRVVFFGVRSEFDLLVGMTSLGTKDIVIVGDCLASSGVSYDEVISMCESFSASDIVVGKLESLSDSDVVVLGECMSKGYNVYDVDVFCEQYLRRAFVPGVTERWFWRYDSQYLHPLFLGLKRSIDIFVSFLGLLIIFPFGLLVSLAILIQDGGSPFYSQVRVGLKNRPFRIYKFRSMRVDAENGGAKWASVRDSRVTLLGKWLRRTRVDETPQFWNIFVGDMSFVGPRPERPEMMKEIEGQIPCFRYRHLVKPGLTGWAQINYPYGASIEDARNKLSYDLYYIKSGSIVLEFVIIFRTAIAMIKGAR